MPTLISLSAQYLYLAAPPLALAAWWTAPPATRGQIIRLALVALPAAFLVDWLLEQLVYVPRPFVVAHVTPLIPHAADTSFPSSHTLLTMTLAAVVFAYERRAGLALGVLSLVVGFTRVLALVHYPLDVVGSALIGAALTAGVWLFLCRLRWLRCGASHKPPPMRQRSV